MAENIILILGDDVEGAGQNARLGPGTIASCAEARRIAEHLEGRGVDCLIMTCPGWDTRHLVNQAHLIQAHLERQSLPVKADTAGEYTTAGEAMFFAQLLEQFFQDGDITDDCVVYVVATRWGHARRARFLLWCCLPHRLRGKIRIRLGRSRKSNPGEILSEIAKWGYDLYRGLVMAFFRYPGKPLVPPRKFSWIP